MLKNKNLNPCVKLILNNLKFSSLLIILPIREWEESSSGYSIPFSSNVVLVPCGLCEVAFLVRWLPLAAGGVDIGVTEALCQEIITF